MGTHHYIELLQSFACWLAVISFFTFFLSLLFIPWIVGKLSQDCFIKLKKKNDTVPFTTKSVVFIILRNVLGFLLLFAGIAMIFLPGQGLLTILFGIILISFPGKLKLTTYLVCRPGVQRSLDWLRKKRGKKTFLWPNSSNSAD